MVRIYASDQAGARHSLTPGSWTDHRANAGTTVLRLCYCMPTGRVNRSRYVLHCPCSPPGVGSGRLPVAQNLRCRVRLSISVLARIHLLSLFELAGETIILQYCAQPRLREGAGPALLLLPSLLLYYLLHTLPGKRPPTKYVAKS